MIRISTNSGAHYVAANNIARLTEASASSQWHGIRTIVRLYDGATMEAQERIEDLRKLVEAEMQKEKS